VVVLGHLGMGDMLVCCGLVRHLAAERKIVLVVCKAVSAPSVKFMYRDKANIAVLTVDKDSDISPRFGGSPNTLQHLQQSGYDLMLLGLHRGTLAPGSGFANTFYDQACIPRDVRYRGFHVNRDVVGESGYATFSPYIFVHDDTERGFNIQVNTDLSIIRPGKADHRQGSNNIFNFVGLMSGAQECHMFDSCYAHMADLMDICPGRRFLHCVKNPLDKCEELFIRPGWQFVRSDHHAKGCAVAH